MGDDRNAVRCLGSVHGSYATLSVLLAIPNDISASQPYKGLPSTGSSSTRSPLEASSLETHSPETSSPLELTTFVHRAGYHCASFHETNTFQRSKATARSISASSKPFAPSKPSTSQTTPT